VMDKKFDHCSDQRITFSPTIMHLKYELSMACLDRGIQFLS
jgi:hypothetical protein